MERRDNTMRWPIIQLIHALLRVFNTLAKSEWGGGCEKLKVAKGHDVNKEMKVFEVSSAQLD